jgi:hypothetical protein
MCLSIPFRIYFKDVSEIMRDCFGLKEEKQMKNRNISEIDMDIIEAQPVSDDDSSVFLHNSDEELEKSYDFMDSD